MPGNPVAIGPFDGGLNNVSLSGEAKDTEVIQLENMEVGEDNSLRSRPPFEYVPSTYYDGTTAIARTNVHGIYRFSDSEWYLIVSRHFSATQIQVCAVLNGDFTSTILHIAYTDTISEVSGYAQIDDIGYFCTEPGSAANGFKWHKTGGFTTIATMPKGTTMASFKQRLWIAGQTAANLNSRLYFSTIDTVGYKPDTWNTSVDYIDIAAGEGGFITALLPLNSSILVFKSDGTWRFSYPSAPKNGQVDKVSGSVGAANANSVVEFENYVYVYDQGRFYELVNNTYTHMNRFVKFDLDASAVDGVADGVDMSIVNRRIIVRYFNTLFVYSIDTKSWSQWRSFIGTPGKFIELPADSASTESSVFIAPSRGSTQNLGANEIDIFNETYRSYMATLIGTGSVSFAGNTMTVNTNSGTTTTAWLNNEDGIANYNVKLSSGHRFKLTGTLTRSGTSTITARMTYLLTDGTTTFTDIVLDVDAVNKTFVAPEKSIAANLHIRQAASTAASYTMLSMALFRDAVASPVTLIKLKDEYRSTPNTVEYIDCVVKTKSYDYKAPASYKRMFWWAADLKTNRFVSAKLSPVAVKMRPTFGDLEAYTHTQLSAGTWGNPLSFLQTVLDIQDGADPSNAITENGRILMKFKKSIRFKQVNFQIELSSLGNKATGPAKLHSLITFVQAKEKVVDRTN